jgi:hypothetical protein
MSLYYVVKLETENGAFNWAVTTNLRQEVHRFRNRAGISITAAVKVGIEGVFVQESTALDVMERLAAADYLALNSRKAV